VEASTLDRVTRRCAVTAVADVARPAALARPLEGLDRLALAEMVERAAVELNEIDVVGGQTLQAALDAGEQWSPTPVGASPAGGVATFGEQIKLVPSSADGLADQD